MRRRHGSAGTGEGGFTLIELMLVISIAAIVGGAVVGVISLWFSTAQGTSSKTIMSSESQLLGGYFLADVSSATVPSLNASGVPTPSCASLPLTLTWMTTGNKTYQVVYAVDATGSMLQRSVAATGMPTTTSVVVHYLSSAPCVTSTGLARTMKVAATLPGTAPYSYSVTGLARSASFLVTLDVPPANTRLNDTTPTLSGVPAMAAGALPTITVRIYAGADTTGAMVQTLTTQASGSSWSVTPAVALSANATYTAQASQVDGAGNVGLSSANTFVVDTTAPVVTLTAPAPNAALSTSTPVFTGTAGALSGDLPTITVKIFSGTGTSGTLAQTLTAQASGTSWSVTAIAALTDGTYTAQASQSDAAGNAGSSPANTFTINTAPVVSLTTPADGSTATTSTPALSGAAGVAIGDLPTITVRIFSGSGTGGTVVQTLTAQASGATWTVTPTTTLADGAYTAQASQRDSAGNTGWSNANTFTVAAAPIVTLTTPSDGGRTSANKPTYSGAAGTSSGDLKTITVKVYVGVGTGGTLWETRTTSAVGSAWSVIGSKGLTANATYTAQASQADSAGNVGWSSVNTFVYDTIHPVVTLVTPADNSTVNNATPTVSGTAGTTSGDLPTITVTLYAGNDTGGTLLQTVTTQAVGSAWSLTPAALADGTYTVLASQSDAAGNVGQSSAYTFLLDDTAPLVTLTTPAGGSSTIATRPPLAGAAGSLRSSSQRSADNATITVRIYAGADTTGAVVQTLTTQSSGSSWSLTPAALADGTYTAQASQSDAAGNTGMSSANTFIVDTAAPVLTLTAPANAARTNATRPTYSGAAGMATGDLATITVKVYSGTGTGGTVVQTLTGQASGATWSAIPTAALTANATYTAQASQSDAAGNAGVSSANTFTVDTAAPVVTLTAPANAAATNVTTPSYAGAAGTATGDLATITVKVYSGTGTGGTVVQTVGGQASGATWSAIPTVALSANATYTAQASQTDAAGNTAVSSANTFVLDTVAPLVTLSAPVSNSSSTNTKPPFGGTAGTVASSATASADGPAITVRVYTGASTAGALVQTLSATASSGSWSVTPSVALAVGTYTAQASQSDGASTTGLSTATTFTVTSAVSNGVTVAPSSSSYNPGGQERLVIGSPSSITALSATIVVSPAGYVYYNGGNDPTSSFPGGALTYSYSTGSGGAITFTYVLNAGQTIPAGYYGTTYLSFYGYWSYMHPTSGDTWTVTSTSNGIVSTLTGTF